MPRKRSQANLPTAHGTTSAAVENEVYYPHSWARYGPSITPNPCHTELFRYILKSHRSKALSHITILGCFYAPSVRITTGPRRRVMLCYYVLCNTSMSNLLRLFPPPIATCPTYPHIKRPFQWGPPFNRSLLIAFFYPLDLTSNTRTHQQ